MNISGYANINLYVYLNCKLLAKSVIAVRLNRFLDETHNMFVVRHILQRKFGQKVTLKVFTDAIDWWTLYIHRMLKLKMTLQRYSNASKVLLDTWDFQNGMDLMNSEFSIKIYKVSIKHGSAVAHRAHTH